MKKKLLMILLAIFLVGCSGSNKEVTNSSETASKPQDTITKPPQATVTPSAKKVDADKRVTPSNINICWSPIGVKTIYGHGAYEVFINVSEGWRKVYEHEPGTKLEKNTLYKTMDGGKSWVEITNSDKASIPLSIGFQGSIASLSGMTFLNSKIGWIIEMSPRNGYVGLYKTKDGGVTWQQQDLDVPDKYKTSMFITAPPVFFSREDGILLTLNTKLEEQLVYVTHDGGKTWIVIPENTNSVNLKWVYKKSKYYEYTGIGSWEIIYKGTIWQSVGGIDWKKPNK